jgi:hypothetical protein
LDAGLRGFYALAMHSPQTAFSLGFLATHPILVSGSSGIARAFPIAALHEYPEMVFAGPCSIYPRSLNG